jgi:sugar/nucleoside kinase (ribokinase family)
MHPHQQLPEKDIDVLVAGGAGIDTIVHVPALPLPMADSIHVPPVHDYVAHTGTGVALGLKALGLRVSFVEAIGDDEQGRLIRTRFEREGLDFRPVIVPQGTRRSVNLVDPLGRRLSLYDGRHPADLQLPRDAWWPLLERSRHVHVSIVGWPHALFAPLIERGASSSTDLHDWDGVNPHHLAYGLKADLVFMSAARLEGRAHEAQVVQRLLREGRAQAVLVTAGAQGSRLWLREQASGPIEQPALPPAAPVVDSNGAGDAFVCGVLSGWLAKQPWQVALHRGALAGAYACTQHGTAEAFIGAAALSAADRPRA